MQGKAQRNLSMLSQMKIEIFRTSGSSSQYLPGHCICSRHRKTFCFVLLEIFPTSIPSCVWKVNNVSFNIYIKGLLFEEKKNCIHFGRETIHPDKKDVR